MSTSSAGIEGRARMLASSNIVIASAYINKRARGFPGGIFIALMAGSLIGALTHPQQWRALTALLVM